MIRTGLLLLPVLVLLQTPPPNQPEHSDAWWRPAPGDRWQVQYSGAFKRIPGVVIYNLDLFDTPVDLISSLHAGGHRVICYFSAGSIEDWRPDADAFPPAAIGNPYENWPGEWWLDIRNPELTRVLDERLDLARRKGCDAVDPDNVNGYENRTGFPLTYDDQIRFNNWLSDAAHRRGLAIGLKNDLDQISDLVDVFDFAVNESCFEYDECDALQPFIDAGKPVYQIEYPSSDPADVCPAALALRFDTIFKKRDLGPEYLDCRSDGSLAGDE
jgi:hypothetical protein